MRTEMLHHGFSSSDPIQILDYLHNFRRSSDLANIHEGAAKWSFPHFMTGIAKQDVLRRRKLNDLNMASKEIFASRGTMKPLN